MATFMSRSTAEVVDNISYVNYIRSSGTQQIDTKFKPNQNTRVVASFELLTETNEQTPFLARESKQVKSFGVYRPSSGWKVSWGKQLFSASSGIAVTERITVDINKTSVDFNGETYGFTSETFTSPVNLVLFARNTNGTLANLATMDLYYCRIYDNDILVRDFHPCYDPEGIACLYEKVDREYYYNTGSGEFIAG